MAVTVSPRPIRKVRRPAPPAEQLGPECPTCQDPGAEALGTVSGGVLFGCDSCGTEFRWLFR